jgi:hypothetical protein
MTTLSYQISIHPPFHQHTDRVVLVGQVQVGTAHQENFQQPLIQRLSQA